ncbi:unnamed protein product [Pieris macdunnoughi]|uniref:Uncharacterized protein n=1 Tax=Pieris macdunnoughi TaxID=345717 RepID=A0A821V9V6_9NEOP|nr:unnamed protein product [Pieris macdunnoughi]
MIRECVAAHELNTILALFNLLANYLVGGRAWWRQEPRARHHGDGGGAARPIWGDAAAAARADGDARRGRNSEDQRARRPTGTLQETLHLTHGW